MRFMLAWMGFSAFQFSGASASTTSGPRQQAAKRVAIAGLVHGHVDGLLPGLLKRTDVQLVAIAEPNKALSQQYASSYNISSDLFHTDLDQMLQDKHPDAVLVYTTILDHRRVIETAAKYGISSMVEKPLSTTMEDALAIRETVRKSNVHVLVNYETTWYSSNAAAIEAARNGSLGTIRKVVVHDGHQGPAEIGVGPEWLPWLTDPVQNGAGALFDFGCYGADLVTVLHGGVAPESVMAVAQTDKPEEYPKVDDDATVILRYNGSQAVLMPSWNWPYSRKDMEVYGTNASVTTVGSNSVVRRVNANLGAAEPVPALPEERGDPLTYLIGVLDGKIKDEGDLTALDTNMVAMQILDAARQSAMTGKSVQIQPLP
ncbi:Gfo/Idh/MocA family oxidoreductase [Apiospora arundinis]|uniref:Gfo/Idh/MocA family oxidoreductase n=1 Tax=Apiospora arundinis TaxID=335852 RepID=A0ABR2JHG3_9PEZI